MFMKRIASIQDISCLGRCSLTVALPIISAMGVECAIMPTAVLSTHTMFKNFTVDDLSDQLVPIANHWKSENVHFDAIYTGYLASGEQVDDVLKCIEMMCSEDTLLFIDPAMADHGKLYPAFGPDFPKAMAKLVAVADVTVPNITEACFLTETPYREGGECDEAFVKELIEKLYAMGAKKVAITGVSPAPGKIGATCYDGKTYCTYVTDKEPVSFHGTGDIFSSVTIGGMMRGLSLEESLALAADYTKECIRVTTENKDHTWYGVEFERVIPLLCDRLK